jgi:hypothetical protein
MPVHRQPIMSVKGAAMPTRVNSSTEYREHDIVFNPTGTPGDACQDAFMVLEPSPNPMFTSVVYEHPADQAQVHGTEEEAYDAAMAQARAWIDARLDRPSEKSS